MQSKDLSNSYKALSSPFDKKNLFFIAPGDKMKFSNDDNPIGRRMTLVVARDDIVGKAQ